MGKKTNAMRLLDQKKMSYKTIEYDIKDGQIDGVSVANKLGKSVNEVYKTLIVQGQSQNYYVLIIPVDDHLNIKKTSKLLAEKKIEMIAVKDMTKITGYMRGGCSPLGMRKHFKTVVDAQIELLDQVIFSAGKIGLQIEMNSKDFICAVDGHVGDLVDK